MAQFNKRKVLWRTGVVAAAAALAACGGSDESDPVVTPSSGQISGTVAIGAAVAAAQVAITDAAGLPVCEVQTVVTDAAGRYSCNVADGRVAPYLIVATDPSGGVQPMVSVGLETPAAGTMAVVNVTPLTTAIVAQLSSTDDALAVASDRTMIDVALLESVKAKVLAQLAPVIAAVGAGDTFDPFTTPLDASTPTQEGNAADRLIEALRITTTDGQWTVAPVDRPDAVVVVADGTSAAPATVAAPSAAASDAPRGMRRLARALNACVALPVAERVLERDNSIPANQGGPEVTVAADACDRIVDGDRFLHNGYRAGQFFHTTLMDTAMVGAQFQPPEVMLVLPDADGVGAHQAIVNLRYRDANGNAGSIITVARRLVQDEAADVGVAGDWVLHGNQQRVETSVSAVIIRREQLAPGAGSGSGPFGAAATSRYESALNLFVNKDGPGSAGLRAARIKGPGLPTAGVVMTPLAETVCSQQHWMNVRRKDGLTDPQSATPSGDVGSSFTLQRTVGLTGADASTRRPNPAEAGGNSTQFGTWAHPLDYGRPVGSTDYVDFGALRAMSTYTMELYYDGEVQPRHTYEKRLLTAVTPATAGGAQQWVQLDAATRGLLDPADTKAAAAGRFDLSWMPNAWAESVASAGVYTGSAAGSVNQGQVAVQRGTTTTVANAPANAACASGVQFPALGADGGSWRNIQLRMRRLDGSSKFSYTRYN